MTISLIAAIDTNNGIGKNNQLLCHLPADLKHFKKLTIGKSLIMGRKTFESIGKALPERQNIILSRQQISITGVDCATSLADALSLVKYNSIMVIGGAAVFEEALPLAQHLYLTIIHHQFEADVFFPSINPSEWLCVEKLFKQKDELNTYDLTFCHYQKRI